MNIDNYYKQQGSGPPIVFIHGSFASTSTWNGMIEKLAATHQCISIKLPGHCGMPDPEDFAKPTMETELAVVEGVVNKLVGNEPVHLVGHSYGGVIALAQALKGNMALSQLTLFEPVAVWVFEAAKDEVMSKRVEQFLQRYRHDVSQQVPYVCGQVIDFWGGDGAFETLPNFIKDSMDLMVSNNIRHWDIADTVTTNFADLQKITVPTCLVHGSQSSVVAHAIVDHLDEQLPNSKKYIIENASHFLVTSHAGECTKVLQHSLTR